MRWLAAVSLVLSSCTAAWSPPVDRTHEPSDGPATTTTPRVFVRTCESRVSGDLGGDWRKGEVKAGPVVFVGSQSYRDDPGNLFAAPRTNATVQKVLLVIAGDRPVEIGVRHPDAALFYDQRKWRDRNVVPFRLGDARTRFEPCGGGLPTQFNGGFLLRGPACVPVEVRVEGVAPLFATLSFGAGDCED
jgi:hypothetical protein